MMQMMNLKSIAGLLAGLLMTPIAWAEEVQTSTVGGSLIKPSEFIGQILFSLMIILFLIFAVAFVVKRFGRFSEVAGGHLKVLGTIAVGHKERIVLLQVGSEQLLIGVTTMKVTTLHRLAEPLQFEDADSAKPSVFAVKLQDALRQRKASESN